jgi:hypothetical protein
MKPTYTKLNAQLEPLPVDTAEEHVAVLVEHPLLAKPIIVAARRCEGEHNFKKAQEVAARHDAGGLTWRAPTVEEAFFIADRTRADYTLDTTYFPDAEKYEWTWTSDVAAGSPSGCAWVVSLGYGYAGWYVQSSRGCVRAVCAGQS